MDASLSIRQQLNSELEETGEKVSINDFIVKACAIALNQPRFSGFNSSFIDNQLDVHPNINIGVAIDLEERGLMVPAIMRCESLSLTQIAKASKDLVDRAKNDKLQAEEYSESTFSVSNLGVFDIESFTAIIHPPNSAVLAVGTVKERPIVKDKTVVISRTMFATFSVDHRVSDGASGARFLVEVKRLLESPVTLL
jgi:pyruvate dehydrogenase E2 component (dihydrolipoamide acetyltransferase)